MDWNSILQSVLAIALPPMVVALVALVVAWINKVAKGLSADQMYAIKEAVSMAVSFAEQTGAVKTGEEKKASAISAAQGYLTKQGITVDLTLLDNMIEAAVKNDINWAKEFPPIAPPEPVATVQPGDNNSPASVVLPVTPVVTNPPASMVPPVG